MKLYIKRKAREKKMRDTPGIILRYVQHADRPESARVLHPAVPSTCNSIIGRRFSLTPLEQYIIHIYIICNYIETFITLV